MAINVDISKITGINQKHMLLLIPFPMLVR